MLKIASLTHARVMNKVRYGQTSRYLLPTSTVAATISSGRTRTYSDAVYQPQYFYWNDNTSSSLVKNLSYNNSHHHHRSFLTCSAPLSLPSTKEDEPMVLYDSLSTTYKQVSFSPPLDSERTNSFENIDSHDDNNNEAKGLAWYTCGPTVYDSAHLGHARTYVTLDIIHRILLHQYNRQIAKQDKSTDDNNTPSTALFPPPMFIMNITDVDDKILTRAKERNISPRALAKYYEEEFWKDMKDLNVMKPTIVTRVTDHVDKSIIPYIEQIMKNGMAYIVPDTAKSTTTDPTLLSGSVYFDVGQFEASKGILNKYGKLAPPIQSSTETEFFSWDNNNNNNESDNGETIPKKQQGKRDPRDFVLWKSRQDGEEELLWDSPWGPGRPGWHIECSAMIESISKEYHSHSVQIHAGGVDLKFPHHTNEIAQAEAYHAEGRLIANAEKEWIPHWVHTGHLHIKGMKMSKSLKNFITIRELLEPENSSSSSSSPLESPADDFRLWCLALSGSYKGPATFSKARLEEAKTIRQKILRFLMDGEQWIKTSKHLEPIGLPQKWGTSEHHLMDLIESLHEQEFQCDSAIVGRSEVDETNSGFDLDGSSYIQAILSITEEGYKYMKNVEPGHHPTSALERTLSAVRHYLSLVGFTAKTVNAGRMDDVSEKNGGQEDVINNESIMMDEFVNFRFKVREIALDMIRTETDKSKKESAKRLLQICDELRDDILPEIGFEIYDTDKDSNSNIISKWRMCLPRKREETDTSIIRKEANSIKTSYQDIDDISRMFHVGIYEGQFLHYDKDGLPTHNADGSEVSKRLRKKLMKKRIAFLKKRNL